MRRELVRQVFVKVGEPGSTLRDLSHMCSTWLSKACGGGGCFTGGCDKEFYEYKPLSQQRLARTTD